MWTLETTTTPPRIEVGCLHNNFESQVHVHRHEQTTDGRLQVTYEISLQSRCKDCGHQMRFPMADGTFSHEIKGPMIA